MSEPESPQSPSPELGGLGAADLILRGLQSGPRDAGPWPPPTPEEVARMLPQYRIDSLLGRGGMGAVYRGVQDSLDRPVAIKLLPSTIADADFVARFRREAKTLAKLQHPGIVSVFDFGQTSEGHLYFVMEFVDGTDLARILRCPGLRPEQALELITQVCDALHYAHRMGVIHRDIKPSNILITKDGRAKVADFGLARPVGEDASVITSTPQIMGTPAYMAPGQKLGHADHRSDIYALGVMLYEMLTGKRPSSIFDPPSVKVQVDVRLDQVVLKALQQEPERRYQEASEMKQDVDSIRSTPPPEPAAPARHPLRARRVAASFAFAVLTIVGAWLWKNHDAPSAPFQDSAWKNAIDLLPLIDATKDTEHGRGTMQGGELVAQSDTTFLLKLPYQPPEEYDFRITFTPFGDEGPETWQLLCASGRSLTYRMGSRGEHKVFGFLFPDASEVARHAASILPPLEKGRRHTSVVQVRNGQVSSFLDGKPLLNWKAEVADLYGVHEDQSSALSDPTCLGIGCWLSGAIFHSIEVREITGKGTLLRATHGNVANTTPATKDQPFVNSLSMKFVPVPITGGPTDGQRVLFSVWDTRVQDYEVFARETKREWPKPNFEQGPTHPAVNVSWEDAQAFCAWLTERERKEGKLSANEAYRLPSDHEWSCAVGIGALENAGATPASKDQKIGKVYPWGTQWPPPSGAGNYADETAKAARTAPYGHIDGYVDGFVRTSPAGSFEANKFGLHDMTGNVYVWCEDRYDPANEARVVRGACWATGVEPCILSSFRAHFDPKTRADQGGFRCVLARSEGSASASSSSTAASLFTTKITDGKATITGYSGAGGEVEIPSTIDGVPVVNIEGAFYCNGNLSGATIARGVEHIAGRAFAGSGLARVTIPDSVKTIEYQSFLGTKLASVTIPDSVTLISQQAFHWCGNLADVKIGRGVIDIWMWAF